MYSRDQIDRVRSSVDIVDVIRGYVPSLKAVGHSVRGLCPFHNEKTPSFYVHPEKAMFKCFGCGEAGDVIGFVSKMEQSNFTETLEKLAEQAGVVLKKEQAFQKREESPREKIYGLLDAALLFYEEHLWDKREGESVRTYLQERGLTQETIQKFRIGFAPDQGSHAFENLLKKGFSIDLCQQAGLVSRSAGGRFYDPLFGRLIFPIWDHFGHVVGFGGRVMAQAKKQRLSLSDEKPDGDGPKYINSPETPVYSKGKVLYGLNQGKAQIMAQRRALILEGYMDVVGVQQAGFGIGVATLGTALTRDHAKLLKRYADEVIAFFDPDAAGRQAAIRGLVPLLQEELFPKVIWLTENIDPDEYILKHGRDAFETLLNQAPDFVDFLLTSAKPLNQMSLQERAALSQQILEIVSHSPNDVLKSEWLTRVASRLGLDADSLKSQLAKVKTSSFNQAPAAQTKPVILAGKAQRLPSAEEEYFELILNSTELWNAWGAELDDFTEERHRRLFELLKSQAETLGKLDTPTLHEGLPETERAWFLNLSMTNKSFADPYLRRDQLLRDIRRNKDKRRLAALSKKVALDQATDVECVEYRDLLRQVKGSALVEKI